MKAITNIQKWRLMLKMYIKFLKPHKMPIYGYK